ncbi:MAG: hypothetical protein ACK5XX_03890 [Holosporales bacterium]|jgi:hypothetical protein
MRSLVISASLFMLLSGQAMALSSSIKSSIDAAASTPAQYNSIVVGIAGENAADAAEIAGYAIESCPPGEGDCAEIAAGLATLFPTQIADIVVQMALASPGDIAAFVVAAVGSFPASERPSAFESILAALKANVPGVADDLDTAAVIGGGANVGVVPGVPSPQSGSLSSQFSSPL